MFSRRFSTITCRISLKSNFNIQKHTSHRSLHLYCRNFIRRDVIIGLKDGHHHRTGIISTAFIRHISETNSSTENVTPNATWTPLNDPNFIIPEPPTPVNTGTGTQEVIETVLTEPTLQSLGLGSWYPPGLIQQGLDFLHTTVGLPWWLAIFCSTICIRTLLFPIVLKSQKYANRMAEVQPKIQALQDEFTQARKIGDHAEVARVSRELYGYMQVEGINPLKSAMLPLIQAPIFLSFFWAIRGMAYAPVESMKHGGLFWFEDLTVADPYYLLPIITSLTTLITIEVGTDTVRAQSLGKLKYVLRAVPIAIFPFILNFPGAVLCYWVSTNFYSLIQVSILRIPAVREYFQIPKPKLPEVKKKAVVKKDFIGGFKESWSNMKMAREVKNRDTYDEVMFEQSGKGPVPKTYAYDPMKQYRQEESIRSKRKN